MRGPLRGKALPFQETGRRQRGRDGTRVSLQKHDLIAGGAQHGRPAHSPVLQQPAIVKHICQVPAQLT